MAATVAVAVVVVVVVAELPLFLDTAVDPPGGASVELDVTFRFLEPVAAAAAAAAAASSSGKLMREKTLGLCFRSPLLAAATGAAGAADLESDVGGACGGFLVVVDDDSDRRWLLCGCDWWSWWRLWWLSSRSS